MSPLFALVLYALGICVLFWLNRDSAARSSVALWLPVVWFWIIGSRPVSVWLGMNSGSITAAQLQDGSPLDAAVFGLLTAAAIATLVRRRPEVASVLRTAWPVALYFAYCLLSALWSDFPDVSLKRWVKSLGDLAMALVVATDADLVVGIKRFYARSALVLLPASLLLIKYYPALGRTYDPFTGTVMETGVSTNKNQLGSITWLLALGALWQMLEIALGSGRHRLRRQFWAQGLILGLGVALLATANSATSLVSFLVGSVLLVATMLLARGHRASLAQALVLLLVVAAALSSLFGADAGLVHALGRQTDLTGRTEIWSLVTQMTPSPVLGAGFESFWLGPRLTKIWASYWWHPNEAHNGYIEVYIELGWVGVVLIALLLWVGYSRAAATLRDDPTIGALAVSCLPVLAVYSLTEAGFRMLGATWFVLLLVVCTASRAMAQHGTRSNKTRHRGARAPESSLTGVACRG